MKAALVFAALLLQAVAAADDNSARHLRTQRPVHVPAGAGGQACAVLDADVYAHAAGESLNDLRLFAAGSNTETPFALTESNTTRSENEAATVRNLGMEGAAIVFDLEMPKRPYTAVELSLDARDFVGSAKVWGKSAEGHKVALGEFAVFDLSGQRLSRSTTLPLQESSFPELHVELQLKPAPKLESSAQAQVFGSNIVVGGTVPPSRAAQMLYTTVAETSAWTQRGRNSVATLRLPPHVPVARLTVEVDPAYKANFLRDVTISAKPDDRESSDSSFSDVETLNGEISQVHLTAGQSGTGAGIDSRQMSVDAVLAANLRGGATVEVTVANGNDTPLPLRSIRLQMRQRRICFEAGANGSSYTLMYGDKELPAPVYDYGRLFTASVSPLEATLGPEQPNPQYAPRADARPFTERHPELLWLGLFAALAALGGVALRSMRHQREGSH